MIFIDMAWNIDDIIDIIVSNIIIQWNPVLINEGKNDHVTKGNEVNDNDIKWQY